MSDLLHDRMLYMTYDLDFELAPLQERNCRYETNSTVAISESYK